MILVTDMPILPPGAGKQLVAAWGESVKFTVEDGHIDWEALRKMLKGGDILFIDRMATVGDYWVDIWQGIDSILHDGVSVQFIEERISLNGQDGDVYNALSAVALLENVSRQRVKSRRYEGQLAAASSGKGNWKNFSKAQIQKIEADRKTMNISSLCRKYGFSRTTYYNMKERGILN